MHVADPGNAARRNLAVLDDLVRQGKVRALGEAATFATADDLNTSQAIAAANGLTPFATMEANYSILVRDAEKASIQRRCAIMKMRLLAYFPLASGLLSGKYRGAHIPTASRLQPDAIHQGLLTKKSGGYRPPAGYRRRAARDQAGRSWLSPGLPEIRLSVR